MPIAHPKQSKAVGYSNPTGKKSLAKIFVKKKKTISRGKTILNCYPNTNKVKVNTGIAT